MKPKRRHLLYTVDRLLSLLYPNKIIIGHWVNRGFHYSRDMLFANKPRPKYVKNKADTNKWLTDLTEA